MCRWGYIVDSSLGVEGLQGCRRNELRADVVAPVYMILILPLTEIANSGHHTSLKKMSSFSPVKMICFFPLLFSSLLMEIKHWVYWKKVLFKVFRL